MMNAVGLFEAKTKFSELCERVAKSRESITVTRRGEPLVMIIPTTEKRAPKSVWESRRSFEAAHGRLNEKFVPPRRLKTRKRDNPLDD